MQQKQNVPSQPGATLNTIECNDNDISVHSPCSSGSRGGAAFMIGRHTKRGLDIPTPLPEMMGHAAL